MSDTANTQGITGMPTETQVNHAIKLTYAQVMLGSVFGASTGGMFLIGFAMGLGADDVALGLMSTIPQLFVVFQFAGAYLVESGFSRKKLTVWFSTLTPLAWFLIAAIPLFGASLGGRTSLVILISVIALVTVSNQFAGSARGSWIGDLIPAERRGRFFGYSAMFGGIIGAAFAIAEGKFLDVIKDYGLGAFTALFFFGTLFGLAAALLHIPQPDCPLPKSEEKPSYGDVIRKTFRNRPFVTLAIVHAITALSGVAGPFWNAYLLRDVGIGYFGVGILNCIGAVSAVVCAPLWGKAVSKFGCRPIMIIGLFILVPASSFWMLVGPKDVAAAYMWVPWGNLLGGVGGSALGVAISTMVYKASYPEGRSIQFAMYSVFVTLIGAPSPLIGGWLVSRLSSAGYNIDLRLTFILWSFCMAAAGIVALGLKESDSASPRHLVFDRFPSWVGARFAATVSAPLGLLEGVLGKLGKYGGGLMGGDRNEDAGTTEERRDDDRAGKG